MDAFKPRACADSKCRRKLPGPSRGWKGEPGGSSRALVPSLRSSGHITRSVPERSEVDTACISGQSTNAKSPGKYRGAKPSCDAAANAWDRHSLRPDVSSSRHCTPLRWVKQRTTGPPPTTQTV